MPTTILTRPNFIGDSLSAITARARADAAADEERHRQEEAKRKRLAMMGGGAALGAGIGLLAAPALGLAGTAAGWGTATTGAGAGISSALLPATSGALGFGGVLSGAGALTAGLTGASLGSQIGGGIDSGDITPALATAANVAQQVMQSQQDFKTYGYNPTPQEKAQFAHAALSQGTNIGAMMQVARAGGPNVMQQFATAHGAATNAAQFNSMARDLNLPLTWDQVSGLTPEQRRLTVQGSMETVAKARIQQAHDTKLAEGQADFENQRAQAVATGKEEWVPNQDEINRLDDRYAAMKAEMANYQEVTGPNGERIAVAGKSPGDYEQKFKDLAAEYRVARRGGTRPVERPPIKPPVELGPTDAIVPDQPFYIGNELKVAEKQKDGTLNFKQLGTRGPTDAEMSAPITVYQGDKEIQVPPIPRGGSAVFGPGNPQGLEPGTIISRDMDGKTSVNRGPTEHVAPLKSPDYEKQAEENWKIAHKDDQAVVDPLKRANDIRISAIKLEIDDHSPDTIAAANYASIGDKIEARWGSNPANIPWGVWEPYWKLGERFHKGVPTPGGDRTPPPPPPSMWNPLNWGG